jgi:hypothetical protein
LMNRFTDHLQVITTNNYYTIADFHTTNHSTLSVLSLISTSLYLVSALHNGYSFAVFSLDVSWYYYFIIIIISGVRLSPLGTAATIGLLYQPKMIDDGD